MGVGLAEPPVITGPAELVGGTGVDVAGPGPPALGVSAPVVTRVAVEFGGP